jgi:hypothetical protein
MLREGRFPSGDNVAISKSFRFPFGFPSINIWDDVPKCLGEASTSLLVDVASGRSTRPTRRRVGLMNILFCHYSHAKTNTNE